jgi:hypothetical protein
MILNEELLTDEGFARFGKQRQSEIIAKHCSEVEERIRTASSRLEAERGSAEACLQFEKECPSMLVRNALASRVEELIAKYWKYKK